MTAKELEYAYSKCKDEDIIVVEQVSEHKNKDREPADSKLNLYECVGLNNFELYNVHVENAEQM